MVLELLPELTNDWAKQPSARRSYPESVERWRADVAKLMPEALKQRPDAERLVDKMLHVVSWESGGDPGAVGDGGIANGLFQSHYVGKGSSPEQQIADAWRLVLPNPNQWTDWGEGVTYQGKPFGALGNYPYDSSGPGGGARVSGGGGGGGGGSSYATRSSDTGAAARVVAKRLDAETARQATVDEERRATLETQLGAPLAALPHEEEARTSHGPDPVYPHDIRSQARLGSSQITPPSVGEGGLADTTGQAAGGYLGGAFGADERQNGVDTGMLYGPPAPSILDQEQGGQQYTEQGGQYVDESARGKLRGELEARRQGESQYGRIPEVIGERPLQIAELGLIGAAPYLAPEAAALPYVGGLATQFGIGTAASRPVQTALNAIPGYENLPGPAKAVAENAPFAAFGRARLAAKVGEGVLGGLALYGGQAVDQRLGLPALPIVGGPAALAAGLVGGVGGHMLGNRVTRPSARAGGATAPAAQRRAPVLEPAAAGGEAGTYDYRIFKPDGNVDVKATAAKIFTDLGSPVHAMLREGVQNGALSRSFSIVKAAAKRDEAARLEEASRPERAPRPAVPDDAVYGATTQDKRYGAVVKAGVEAASTGNQVALIEQNLRKNGTTWADWGDAQASMQTEVPSWLKRPEEGAGGKAHTPDDVAGLVSDIRAAVQAVREQRAGTDTRAQMGAAARRVRGPEERAALGGGTATTAPTFGSEMASVAPSSIGGVKSTRTPGLSRKGEPGSVASGTWNSPDGPAISHVVYDTEGNAAGVFTGVQSGRNKGLFKITVRPDAQRTGIGTRLLDEADAAGFPVAEYANKNNYTPEGRALVQRWLGDMGSRPSGTKLAPQPASRSGGTPPGAQGIVPPGGNRNPVQPEDIAFGDQGPRDATPESRGLETADQTAYDAETQRVMAGYSLPVLRSQFEVQRQSLNAPEDFVRATAQSAYTRYGEELYRRTNGAEGIAPQGEAARAGMREAPAGPSARESISDYVTRLESMDAKQLRQESNRIRNAAGVGGQEMRAAAREKLDAFESLMERRQSGNYSPMQPPAARQRGTGQGQSIISQRQAREAEVPEVRLTKDLPAIKPQVLADFHLQPPPEGTPPGRLHQPEPKAKAAVIVHNQPGLDAVGPVSRNGQRVGNMYVGDLPDVDTWVAMTEDSAPSEQQIFQDARYYPEVPAQLQQLFQTSTPEEFSRIVRGYAMGNRRTSSERAAGDVLRVEERLAGVQRLEPNKQGVLEQSKGSMNADIIARALELDPSQEGVGPKLFDFEDLLMGKTEVRTWAGDDPRGGKPFVADTHTSRDAGYIDDEVARYVKKLTGKSLEEMGLKYDQVPVTGGSNGFNPSQVQYELINRWGNEMTAELNKRSWLGKSDWEPSEIQAIGWARVRRELGLEDSGAASVRTTNTFQIAVPSLKRELDLRGVELPRSELAQVNDRYLDAAVDTVHEHIPQARFTKTESAGLDGVRYDVFSSPETAHEVALALSHATEGPVYYYREAKSGKQNHVDVVVPEGRLSRQDAGAIAGAVENLSTSVTYSADGHLRIFGTPGGERGRAQIQAAIDAVPGDTAVQLRHGNGDLVKVGEDGSHADAVDTLARTRRDAAAALQLRDPLRARWTDAALAPGEHTRTPGGDVGATGPEPGAGAAAPSAGGFAVPPGAAGIAGGPSGGRPPRRPKAQEPTSSEDIAAAGRSARQKFLEEAKATAARTEAAAKRVEAAKPAKEPAARPTGLRRPTPEAMGETGPIRTQDTRFREEPTVEVEPEGAPSGLRGALQSAAAEARALVSAPIALKSTLSPPFLRQGLARVVTNPVKAVRELKQSLRLALNDTGATELNDSIKADEWVRDSKAYLKEQAAKPRTGPAGQGPRGAHDGYTWQDVEGQVLEWKDSGLERMTLAELKEVADRAGSSYSSKATKEQVLGQLKRDMTPEELAGFSNTRVGRAAEWWTRPSNRQAALQLNLNRTNWYKEVAQQMWDAGERDVKQYRDLRQTIEQATQRGSWAQPGKLPAFFSTRAMSGRVQFAWRGVDAIARGGLWDKAGPRREASRAFTATVVANAAMLGGAYAAASAAGLEPSIDWDGKLPTLKVGTHHWDPWAGLNTPARFAVGVVMDTIENPEGGLENVPQAFGASAYKRGAKFLRGGLSPVFGKAVDIGTGRDYTGRKYNLAQDVTSGNLLKDLTAPFIAESTLESAQQGGPVAAAITTPASFLSTSINAYDTPEDTANALAKKNYNGRSYDQLKTPEQLKVIDAMPVADKARVKEAKQDKYKEELKKSGFVEPEAKPKDKVETLDEEAARERRNDPVNAKNREIIAKDPELEVQRWFFADEHGGALRNKDAVNTAIALGLPEREVKFAGHARDFGRSDEDKAFWNKYGNWLDDIENVRPNSPKNQDNYAAYLFEGKKYKDLKDTEKSRVRSAIHSASIDDPRSEALQVFAGGVGPNQNGEYVLSSPEVKAELEKLWKAYPKARRLPVLEHNGHKTTTLTKPGTR